MFPSNESLRPRSSLGSVSADLSVQVESGDESTIFNLHTNVLQSGFEGLGFSPCSTIYLIN